MNRYGKINKARWDLATLLAKELHMAVLPLYPFDHGSSKKAKVPILAGWQHRGVPTAAELREWRNWDGGFCNTGLVLGGQAGYVAIDVDGREGLALLKQLAGRSVPKTVLYYTPGGGLRFLYRVPKQHRGKRFKKFVQAGRKPHSEVALLGDGCQTVAPLSIHPNGGVYEFKPGYSFDEMGIADMPSWMTALMLNPEPSLMLQAKGAASNRLERMIQQSDCPYLQKKLAEQAGSGVTEEEWFRIISLLVGIGLPEAAMNFSRLSAKHDARSEKRIEAMIRNEEGSRIRCTTLGCSSGQISQCFGGLKHDRNGESRNSPATKLVVKGVSSKAEEMGLRFSSDGEVAGLDINRFVKYFLKIVPLKIELATRPQDTRFYYFCKKRFWQATGATQLQIMARRLLEHYAPHAWQPWMNVALMHMLPVFSDIVKKREKRAARRWISFLDGVYSIDEQRLQEHDQKIFSTTQIPIIFRKKAACPEWFKFLDDVFMEDQEMVRVMGQIFGYCMSSSVQSRKAFFLLGDKQTGKSTCCDVLRAVVGPKNTSALRLEQFGDQFLLSEIENKLVNIAPESDCDTIPDVALLKSIITGDAITLNRKYIAPYNIVPFVKIFTGLNHMPRSGDFSGGFQSRVMIIPFRRTYSHRPNLNSDFERKIDVNMTQKLINERAGIIQWALKGLQELKSRDYEFSYSKVIDDAVKAYVQAINPFVDFQMSALEAVTVNGMPLRGVKIYRDEMYEAFLRWAKSTGNAGLVRQKNKNEITAEIRSALRRANMYDESARNSNGKGVFFPALRLKGQWGNTLFQSGEELM